MVHVGGPGLTAEGLKSVVDFMYTGLLRIEPTTVWDILTTADILLLAETRRVILESYLIKMVELSNCISCKRVGEMYACQTLVDTANNFIVRNFEQVFRQNSEDFCRQVEKVEELLKWLEEDSLFITSEDFLLKVCKVVHAIHFDFCFFYKPCNTFKLQFDYNYYFQFNSFNKYYLDDCF